MTSISRHILSYTSSLLFYFNDPATTDIYTLSLHDALPIFLVTGTAYAQESATLTLRNGDKVSGQLIDLGGVGYTVNVDRKSTRLNSSHTVISYAVFCLKKKKKKKKSHPSKK